MFLGHIAHCDLVHPQPFSSCLKKFLDVSFVSPSFSTCAYVFLTFFIVTVLIRTRSRVILPPSPLDGSPIDHDFSREWFLSESFEEFSRHLDLICVFVFYDYLTTCGKLLLDASLACSSSDFDIGWDDSVPISSLSICNAILIFGNARECFVDVGISFCWFYDLVHLHLFFPPILSLYFLIV